MNEKRAPNFPCPHCGERSAVKDSRPASIGGASTVKRRRICLACHQRWTTYETVLNAGRLEQRLGSMSHALDTAIERMYNLRAEIVALTVSADEKKPPSTY